MNSFNSNNQGKTQIHGRGTGPLDGSDVEQRAREIATIKGRSPENIYPDDLDEARRELHGEQSQPALVEDEDAVGSLSRDPSEPPSIPGQKVDTDDSPDEEDALERMVLDGVEEAQHDQMLEARKQRQ